MTATLQNVTVNQGDTLTITIGPILDQATGGYSNLANATAIWALAKGYGSSQSDVMLTKTTPTLFFTSQVISGNVAYFLNIPLLPADTVGIPPSPMNASWYHEAEVTDASGNVATVTTGNFTLLCSVINQ
jgi:hypothetical protein